MLLVLLQQGALSNVSLWQAVLDVEGCESTHPS